MEPGSLEFWLLISVGPLIGVLGGAFGVWNSLRSCQSAGERRVIWRWTWILSAGITVFLVAFFLVPSPWSWFLWIPYGIALPAAIVACNLQLARARVAARSAKG